MQRTIEDINKELKDIRLSPEEKVAMLTRLRSFMSEHPLPADDYETYDAVPSPFFVAPLHVARGVFSTLAILALVGGSVAAAESSLPGDVLYPVKVNVNENVRSAVIVSPHKQAVWDAQRAVRRLEETEKLAVAGKLDANTTAELEARFEEHAEKSIARAEESNDPSVKAIIHAEIEATLEAHDTVIKNLMDADETLKTELKDVRRRVAEKAEVSEDARQAAEEEIVLAAVTLEEKELKKQKWELNKKIDEIEESIDDSEDELDPELADEIDDTLDDASHAFNKGKIFLKDKELEKALIAFQDADRYATQADVLLSIATLLSEQKAKAAQSAQKADEATTTPATTTDATAASSSATTTIDSETSPHMASSTTAAQSLTASADATTSLLHKLQSGFEL